MPPPSAGLSAGWNSLCYGGLTGSVGQTSSGIGPELGVLYTLSSDQVWQRYATGRPDITNIENLDQLTPILALVTE